MKVNFLSKALDFIRDVFEHASPSILAMLATFLPYLTPLPIAFLTAGSAEEFLGMSPTIAGVFVFILEGVGLWTTTILVDTIVEYIKSRNKKSGFMVIALLFVVGIYVTILINLNVNLEQATKEVNPIYSRIITLICFLPLISGFMNGYYKLQLEHKAETERLKNLEEQHYQEKRKDKKERYALSKGINPMTLYQIESNSNVAPTPAPQQSSQSTDWRVVVKTLDPKQIQFIANCNDWKVISKMYNLSERSARNWITNAQKKLSQ